MLLARMDSLPTLTRRLMILTTSLFLSMDIRTTEEVSIATSFISKNEHFGE